MGHCACMGYVYMQLYTEIVFRKDCLQETSRQTTIIKPNCAKILTNKLNVIVFYSVFGEGKSAITTFTPLSSSVFFISSLIP